MQVEDVNDNFQGEMKLINNAIVNTAIRKGVTKEDYKFMQFNIKDNDQDY